VNVGSWGVGEWSLVVGVVSIALTIIGGVFKLRQGRKAPATTPTVINYGGQGGQSIGAGGGGGASFGSGTGDTGGAGGMVNLNGQDGRTFGAGGGGGAGVVPGAGGAGGAVRSFTFAADDLPDTIEVIVGEGGLGGTNDRPAQPGGASSFGTFGTAEGGAAGASDAGQPHDESDSIH